MKILYIAYSCNPYEGGEDKIGWNVPLESAKTNKVFVITKEDQREQVERCLKKHKVFLCRYTKILQKSIQEFPLF